MAHRIQFKKLTDQTPKFGAAFGGDRMEALAKLSANRPEGPALPATPVEPPKEEALAPVAEPPGAIESAAAVELSTAVEPEPVVAAENSPSAAVTSDEPPPGLPDGASFQLPTPPPGSTAQGPAVDEPVSEALLNHSRKPALMRAAGTILKWTFLAAVLLGTGLYFMRGILFPVVSELKKDKNAPVVVDKEASTFVKSVQQTRQVLAKNDANVDYLNQIVDGEKAKPVTAAPVVPPLPPVVPPVPAAASVTTAAMREKEQARYREAVASYEVSGVRDGDSPRLFHNGQIVKFGDIIDRPLGLRFVGVNAEERVVLFANADNEIFRKPY
ncbi:MAG: hypothetical protein NTV51_08540 [Verrucomicrobia bacterium]|nr:hypothetical protein [Verrucomicrobiota bacterium]